MSDIIYGCDCTSSGCNVHGVWGYDSNAPVIRTVIRNGKDTNLCSRCTVDGEKIVKIHIKEDTDLMPFFLYDPCLSGSPECEGNDRVRELTRNNQKMVDDALEKDIKQMKQVGWKG